jgi:hypothetical protein
LGATDPDDPHRGQSDFWSTIETAARVIVRHPGFQIQDRVKKGSAGTNAGMMTDSVGKLRNRDLVRCSIPMLYPMESPITLPPIKKRPTFADRIDVIDFL